MTDFKLGDPVRIKANEVDKYTAHIQSKIRGRIGVVTGTSYPNGYPIVTFPAFGRKKEFLFGIVNQSRLERVEAEE